MGGGVTRTASVHVPVSRGSTHSTDVSTQTEGENKTYLKNIYLKIRQFEDTQFIEFMKLFLSFQYK